MNDSRSRVDRNVRGKRGNGSNGRSNGGGNGDDGGSTWVSIIKNGASRIAVTVGDATAVITRAAGRRRMRR